MVIGDARARGAGARHLDRVICGVSVRAPRACTHPCAGARAAARWPQAMEPAGDRHHERGGPAAAHRPKPWSERGRVVQVLTFWLRPAFALRVLGRFQRIAGFDRSIALASSALTAVVPLAIV